MPAFPSAVLPTDSPKIRFKEPFVSEGLNRKANGVIPVGVYRGYEISAFPNGLLQISPDPAKGDSVAVVETLQNFNLTVRTVSSFILDFTGHVTFPVFVVLRVRYQISPSPLTGFTQADILVVNPAINNANPLNLHDDDVKLCEVTALGFMNTPVFNTTIPGSRNQTGGLVTASTSIFGGAKQATRVTDFGVVGAAAVPGTQVSFTLTRTQNVLIMVTSGGLLKSPAGEISEAFILLDGFTTFRIGHNDGSDSGGTVVESGQAAGFVFISLAAGVHTAEIFFTSGPFGGAILSPMSVLVLAAEPI